MATLPRCRHRRKGQYTRRAQQRRRQRRQTKRRRRPRRPPPLPNALRRVCGALLQAFAAAFRRPTYERFVVLLLAAILTTGGRTILNLLRTVGALAPGHPSSYHRVFSRRPWSVWRLGRALAGYLLRRWLPSGTVAVAGDDTVAEHKGKQVYGNYASHRLAHFAHRHRRRLVMVSRFYAAAGLYAPPPPVAGKKPAGRPRVKGAKQPTPQEVVAAAKRRQLLNVAWYGGGRRDIAAVTGTGHGYRGGAGLVPVR